MDRIASSRGKAETLCLVCGDKASGRHYGVPSCDGCRGFFKRSIRRNLDYLCKESNQCVVDVSRRNQCQACRFRRCLEVNMKRDAVQHERAPRGALKRSYAAEFMAPMTAAAAATPLLPAHHPLPSHSSSIINGSQQSGGSSGGGGGVYCAQAIPFSWRPTITIGHPSSTSAIAQRFPFNPITPSSTSATIIDSSASSCIAVNLVKEDEVSSSANEDAIQSRRLEDVGQTPTLPKAKTDTTKPLLESSFLRNSFEDREDSSDINEAAARLLLFAVRWAKTIPSFCQLSFRDQNLLLEDSWCELFILTIAQWGLNLDEVQLSRACLEIPNERQEFLRDILQQMRQVVLRIQRCRLDHTEFACLKALVLFKPETRGLRDELAVEILQDQTQIMLQEYCSPPPTIAVRPNGLPGIPPHPMMAGRFGKILLLLPTLRAIPISGVIDLFFRKLIGDLSIARLLTDLMSAGL